MFASYNWLKEYVDLKLSPDEAAVLLTSAGLEVKEVKPVLDFTDRLAVAEVLSIAKHPQADRLRLVTLRHAEGEQTVVCGAANVAEGQKIILALEGAVLPGGIEIKKAQIRGVESSGMICSLSELGLEEKSEGILVLDAKAKISDKVSKHLGEKDYIFDVDLTSNRADCLSILGIARELAAVTGAYVSHKEHSRHSNRTGNVDVKVSAPERCPRYMARIIKGVKIQSSPQWLVRRLALHQIRSINNIVDITNLILLEYGQPLHAFDLHKLAGGRINVRLAAEGEKIKTLDGIEYELGVEDLVIADAEKPAALAGIMGGEYSAIDSNTADVLIEAACFTPQFIRRTSKRLKCSSESSARFERGVDIEAASLALNYAVDLILEMAGGFVSSGLKDVYLHKTKPEKVTLRYSSVERYLGVVLKKTEITSHLSHLGFKVIYKDQEKLQLAVPAWRFDIRHEWDLIEEIARLHGYNSIPETLPHLSHDDRSVAAENLDPLRRCASALGYDEIVSYSFVENQWLEKAGYPAASIVKLSNAISADQSCLRSDLLFNLLKAFQLNFGRRVKDFSRIFEIGAVFAEAGKELSEKRVLAFAGCGTAAEGNWTTEKKVFDFFDLKGDLEAFFNNLNCGMPVFEEAADFRFSAAASVKLMLGSVEIGRAGKCAKSMLKPADLEKHEVYYAEIYLDALKLIPKTEIRFSKISSFPSIERDLALVMNKSQSVQPIIDAIGQSDARILSVKVSDVFTSDTLGESKKSVVFSMDYNSSEGTLAKEEVDKAEKALLEDLQNRFGAVLRT